LASGAPRRNKILAKGPTVDPAIKTDDLTADDQVKIRQIIDSDIKVEGDLRREVPAVDQSA